MDHGLKTNTSKIHSILLGNEKPRVQVLESLKLEINNTRLNFVDSVKNFGIVIGL